VKNLKLNRLAMAAAAVVVLAGSTHGATVNYVMQAGNFDANHGAGSGFHGFFNNGGSEIGIFANGAGDSSFAAFQTFSTTGAGGISARPFQVGDSFSLTAFVSANPPNRIGISFRSSTSYTGFNSVDSNVEAKFQLNSSGGWNVLSSGSTLDSSRGAGQDVTLTLLMTSSNTFNATVVRNFQAGSFDAFDLQSFSGAQIQSFGLYAVNSANDTFWKNGSLTDTGNVTFGGGNGSSTISGTISDGLAANSTSVLRSNALTKNGSGRITLTAANSYTGVTTINSGTVQIGAGGATGTLGTGLITNNANLEFARSNAYNAGSAISGSGNVIQSGTGVLTLPVAVSHTYAGFTTIKSGTLILDGALSGAGGAVSVGNGSPNTGILGGSGTVSRSVNINDGGTVAPGSGISGNANTFANLTLDTGAASMNGGGAYEVQIKRRADEGGATAGVDWDTLTMTSLSVAATTLSKFKIKLVSLNSSNVAGSIQSWNPLVSQTWVIGTVSGSVTGFDNAKFEIDYSQFAAQNTLAADFYVWMDGTSLKLTYIPEPNIAGGVMLLAAGLFRRPRHAPNA
jgi:fibronectin-binding autotransporter adhesin